MIKNLKIVIIVWGLVIAELGNAAALIPQAEELRDAYKKLQVSRNNSHYQKLFLASFPSSKTEFNRLFNSPKKDQLFDGNDYIFQLERLAVNHPKQTFQLVLKLASELKWQTGAANYLQFVLMKISLNDPLSFSSQLQSLGENKKRSVIGFMAQGKSGPGVGYTQLVSVLRRLDKNRLANQLEDGLYP